MKKSTNKKDKKDKKDKKNKKNEKQEEEEVSPDDKRRPVTEEKNKKKQSRGVKRSLSPCGAVCTAPSTGRKRHGKYSNTARLVLPAARHRRAARAGPGETRRLACAHRFCSTRTKTGTLLD